MIYEKFSQEMKDFNKSYDDAIKKFGEENISKFYKLWCINVMGSESWNDRRSGLSDDNQKHAKLGLRGKPFMRLAIKDLKDSGFKSKEAFALSIKRIEEDSSGINEVRSSVFSKEGVISSKFDKFKA